MGRHIKQGVDYFPHDTTSGKTMFTLESMYGNDGYAFWFKLLELLGTQEGLYYDCNNQSNWMFLVAKTRVNEITATEILELLSSLDAIDRELWGQKIIWVQKFVDRLVLVFKKRNTEIPFKPDTCHGNTCKSSESVTESAQSKVKESKVKESKVIYAEFVSMTQSEYDKLIADHGEEATRRMIEILDNAKGSKGYKYKSDYRAILTWVVERYKEEQEKHKPAEPKPTIPPEYRFRRPS